MKAKKYVVGSLIFSAACALGGLLALASARAIDGGPYWGRGPSPFYAMPIVESFAFFTTLVAMFLLNLRRAFLASAVWPGTFGTLFLGGGYVLKGHEGVPHEIFRWSALASIDLVSAMLFAGAILVFPAIRRRLLLQ